MTTTTEVSAMNKAEIIAELENMVAARLFSRRPWLADRETFSAYHRRLIQMGLVEQVHGEPPTWRYTPLGKEVDGIIHEWDVPFTLEEHGLLDQSEFDAISECTSEGPMRHILLCETSVFRLSQGYLH